MQKQDIVTSTIGYLGRFESEIRKHNEAGLTDINKYAEDVIGSILNEILQCKLVNLNKDTKNYPAIDLGDPEKGISVQVTGSHDARKIYETLTKFLHHERNKEVYHTLYIFFLSTEGSRYNEKKITEIIADHKLEFSAEKHIINMSFITRSLTHLDDMALDRIHGVLEFQLQDNMITNREKSYKNEIHQRDALHGHSQKVLDAIKTYQEYDAEKITPEILPEARILESSDIPGSGDTFDKIVLQLRDKDSPHIFLLGEGGAGKTTSLLWTWKTFLKNKEGMVPIYINLPDVKPGRTLLQHIEKKYYGPEGAAEKLEEVLLKSTDQKDHRKVLLLLDGFNQLPKGHAMLDEIYSCGAEWKGTQIVVASRHNGPFDKLSNFTSVELQPLHSQQVKDYAAQNGNLQGYNANIHGVAF